MTPPAHRANEVSTRRIVANPEDRSSLVRPAFPRDHEADASGSQHNTNDEEILFTLKLCPDEEAWVTLKQIASDATSVGLQMKSQGTYNCEQIEVDYMVAKQAIEVWSCTGGAWTQHGTSIPKPLGAGDQLGARYHSASGEIEIFVNGNAVTSIAVKNYPYQTNSGKIGLAVYQSAGGTVLDDFGGGP
jgi:hypothetical protein